VERLIKEAQISERIIFEEVRTTMDDSLSVLDEQVSGRTPVGVTGQLRQSIAADVRGRSPNLTGILTTPLPYGLPVEQGRDPGKMPPISAIELWVIRKQIAPPGISRGVAWAIAIAISRGQSQHQQRGGSKMFEKGFQAGKPIVEKLWANFATRVANRIERRL
jgi:hypothetical protein